MIAQLAFFTTYFFVGCFLIFGICSIFKRTAYVKGISNQLWHLLNTVSAFDSSLRRRLYELYRYLFGYKQPSVWSFKEAHRPIQKSNTIWKRSLSKYNWKKKRPLCWGTIPGQMVVRVTQLPNSSSYVTVGASTRSMECSGESGEEPLWKKAKVGNVQSEIHNVSNMDQSDEDDWGEDEDVHPGNGSSGGSGGSGSSMHSSAVASETAATALLAGEEEEDVMDLDDLSDDDEDEWE